MEDDPDYDIAISRVSGNAPDCDRSLRAAIETTLRRHHTPKAQISVAIVDDHDIARLNLQHLKHEGPTDVLAFDLGDTEKNPNSPASTGCDHPAAVDGEIVVSEQTARREAELRGHRPEAELALYVVHGLLHLLGYGDHNEQDAALMHRIEDEILSAIGMGSVYQGDSR